MEQHDRFSGQFSLFIKLLLFLDAAMCDPVYDDGTNFVTIHDIF